MKSPYPNHLYYSPGWIERARQTKALDGYACQHCGSQYNLTVHHKRYDPYKEIWEYVDEDLITLCWDCHKAQHYDSAVDKYKMNQ